MATPNPNIIYRSGSAGPLTFDQLDGNFAFLSQSIANISTPVSTSYATSASYAVSASYAPSTFSSSVSVSGSILPNTDGISKTSSFNLGSPTNAWKSLYVSDGTINFVDGAGNIVSTIGTGNNLLIGNTIISGSLRQGSNVTASGDYSHAEGIYSTASGYYSHAEGGTCVASGVACHAEGNSTKAIGNNSHSEGLTTIAIGVGSHSEGLATSASGDYSHAEGYFTEAIGANSHAEGSNTISFGPFSHAEGWLTLSSGYYSHAEGYLTTASAQSSHAEGYGTIASASYQHVSGKFNIASSKNNDLFIVGNGTDNSNRSNALVVKSSGSLALPTTQSAAPSWTGVDGEMAFATVTGNHYFYVWMAGAWRSGSLA
jgi:hypothetical protein